MQGVRVAGHDVGGHRDAGEVGDLVLPQLIHQRVGIGLGEDVLFPVLPEEAALLKLAGEPGVGHAAAHHEIAVDIRDTLPGLIAARWGGCSAAVNHWETAR